MSDQQFTMLPPVRWCPSCGWRTYDVYMSCPECGAGMEPPVYPDGSPMDDDAVHEEHT